MYKKAGRRVLVKTYRLKVKQVIMTRVGIIKSVQLYPRYIQVSVY